MNTFKDLFLNELADMYDAEHRIIKALPKMIKAATCNHLKKAFQAHLKETESQVRKLEQVFKSFGVKAKAKTCDATVGLLKEGDEIASDFKGSPAINAGYNVILDSLGITTDFEGNPRVRNDRVDIGAYETNAKNYYGCVLRHASGGMRIRWKGPHTETDAECAYQSDNTLCRQYCPQR